MPLQVNWGDRFVASALPDAPMAMLLLRDVCYLVRFERVALFYILLRNVSVCFLSRELFFLKNGAKFADRAAIGSDYSFSVSNETVFHVTSPL